MTDSRAPHTPPARFMIFSGGRAGSTSLALILREHPDVGGVALEPFNPGKPGERCAIMDQNQLASRLALITEQFIGFKHVWQCDDRPFPVDSGLNESLLDMFQGRTIVLERKNRLKRIVSMHLCMQTHAWSQNSQKKFDFSNKILPLEPELVRDQMRKEKLLIEKFSRIAQQRSDMLSLWYEDLFENKEIFEQMAILEQICVHLDIRPLPPSEEVMRLLAPDIRQHDHAWYRRIPNIEEIEQEFGGAENGWLFRDDQPEQPATWCAAQDSWVNENALYRPESTGLEPSSILRKAPGASLERGYDHYLLLAPNDKCYRLNTQSAALFEMCDGNSSINEIVKRLQEAFPDSACDIREQVMEALTELRSRQAIELLTAATADAVSRHFISDPSRARFVVASYVTEDTPYEIEVENLTRSCNRWGLRHVVIKYRDRGGYHNNVRIMPEFILRVMEEHPHMDILYLDADCVVEAYPELLLDFSADVGFWYDYRDGAPSIHAGTIYMKNKRETRKLLRYWIKLLVENPKLTEEEVVRMACMKGEMDVDDWLRGFGLSFWKLPQSYVHNYDAPLVGKAVIEHYCSGRRLHIKTDRNIHDPFLWAAPNFVCIKAGSGEKYTAEYVNRLYAGIHKNFTRNYRFVCLTDDHRGLDRKIEVFPLPDAGLTGWWHKLSLFMPEVYDLQGLIWYFDLDQVVIENIDCFMDIEGEFLSIPDPSWPGEFNTSIMRFRVGRYSQIWESFKRNKSIMKEDCNDQNWVNLCGNMRTSDDVGIKTRRLQKKFPQYMPATQVIESFPAEWINIYDSELVGKSGAIKGIDRPEHISSNCRIVVCYGHTSLPHNTWLREYW